VIVDDDASNDNYDDNNLATSVQDNSKTQTNVQQGNDTRTDHLNSHREDSLQGIYAFAG
jgi:hypothetical protein